MYTQHSDGGLAAELWTVRFGVSEDCDEPARHRPLAPELLYRIEGTGKGTVMFTGASVSPDRTKLLLMMENDGWAHHYILDLATKEVRQVTFGECEDFAHAGDSAKWLPDGSGFLYSSNKDVVDQRHIYRYSLEMGESGDLVSPGPTRWLTSLPTGGWLSSIVTSLGTETCGCPARAGKTRPR